MRKRDASARALRYPAAMLARFGAAALVGALITGCTTPCGELDARAHDCKTVPSRYADDRRAACTVLRQDVTAAAFDAFADCVGEAECRDPDAIDRCEAEHFPDPPDACRHYRLWAAACGLEPIGTEAECATLRDGMTDTVFEEWVACITTDGCPQGDDPRYDRCQDVLFPPAAGEIIDACVLIIAWTTECADQAPDFFPVTETNVGECVSLAEPFSSESFLTYGQCLSAIECDDIPGRLDCLLKLEVLDPGDAVASCERLVAYSNGCGSTLGGGSVEACSRLFARFTPGSLDAFVACLEGRPCDDPNATAECAGWLELR